MGFVGCEERYGYSMNILVSACLLGIDCRYDGGSCQIEKLAELNTKHHLIPVCPEIYGGLPTPREPAEIQGGKVITKSGRDVTYEYQKGAREILKLAKFYDCSYAILKEHSPSCGLGQIYDGTFRGKLTDGNGILADLLSKEGIRVIGETGLEELPEE
jgi:uncharacterized protein YbbK (DUF523 family)